MIPESLEISLILAVLILAFAAKRAPRRMAEIRRRVFARDRSASAR
jgi:hypothetical protein